MLALVLILKRSSSRAFSFAMGMLGRRHTIMKSLNDAETAFYWADLK